MRGGIFKLTPAQREAFARDWLAGVRVRELAARYHIGIVTVGGYRRLLNLPKRKPGRPVISTGRTSRYRPRPKRPEPVDFPFRYIPPKPLRAKLWRCDCGQLSELGPVCGRCATNQEAA